MDVLPANGLQHDGVDVLLCDGDRLHIVGQVQAVMIVRMIKEESVCVFIPDNSHQGDTPEFGPCAWPPFENGRC